MKRYRAIFFDWDGTAVVTRDAPVDDVMPLMVDLLRRDVILVVISGTTYEKIAQGRFHEHVPKDVYANLYMGLGRGAYDYGFGPEGPITLHEIIPDTEERIRIHELAFEVHKHLLGRYGYETDIVFTRPNYCKIDLLVKLDRGGKLYFQPDELDLVNGNLERHGYKGGVQALIADTLEIGQRMGLDLQATTDAKFLEVGPSTKADNVDYLLEHVVFPRGIGIEDCCFWGDEFNYLGPGVSGSDALMITDRSRGGDFFDVSKDPLELPEEVQHVGGGVASFLAFLEGQIRG